MTAHYAAPHRGGSTPVHENAALLIDFDNVTMGIRSDLTKELKNLLDSDIIRGKVAVQRAYADWRRYPQYIVPLSEGSVDLIFAPAYGSSKKNATDIRLAIDALELVFTRPEIGTFILLSGDSDFSSLVLKLKEYGKYVIGVGIKESSSDLLVQNCHEYYSYNALTGLQRAGDEAPSTRMDPWELVQAAVERMAENDDVMRSDRLKQVMIELDEAFDEKAIGYSKYNRFLSDASTRGRIKLRKLENGQFEVAPVEGRRKSAAAASGGRPAPAAPSLGAVAAAGTPAGAPTMSLDAAYELLRRAVRDLAASGGDAVRDSDVKRRMLELRPDWDEAAVGFGRFSHFLRQAHNSEVIDLQRTGDGTYEVVLPAGGASAPAAAASDEDADDQIATGAVARPEGGRPARMERGARSERPERGGNGRRGRRGGRDREREGGEEREERAPRSRGGRGRGRDRDRDAETLPPSEPRLSGDEATGVVPAAEEKPAAGRTSEPGMQPASEERLPAPESSSLPVATQATAAAPAKASPEVPAGLGRGRRGPRGRGASAAPPPLLPGQAIDLGGSSTGSPAAPSTPTPQRSPEVHDVAPMADQIEATSSDAKPGRDIGPIPKLSGVLDPKQLGLPTEAGAVTRYLTNRYRGVGDKTAEQLVETFGAEHVFAALQAAPDRVTELLGAHRAGALLDAWRTDFARRSGDEMPPPVSSTRSARRSAYEEDDYAAAEPAAADDSPQMADEAAATDEPDAPAAMDDEPAALSDAAAQDGAAGTDSADDAAEPVSEAEPTSPPAYGGVERELPQDGADESTERELPAATADRDGQASDVEREPTPDLWSNAREPRRE